jgi:VWFA-related protein
LLRAEEMMRSSPESSLGALADETGGAFWHDTNDLGAGFRYIEEDLSGYYVLSYMPTNTTYDGRFRRIRLKVRRPHRSLQSRQGYLAVRTALPKPILAH